MTTNPTGDPVPDADAEVGARVHQLMFLKRVSQTKLAPQLGISQSVLSKKLRGSVPWSVTEVIRAAVALQVPPAELLPPIHLHPVSKLPPLDLNQQPCGYISLLVSASGAKHDQTGSGNGARDAERTNVYPLFRPGDVRRYAQPHLPAQPHPHQPFRPILVESEQRLAI